MVSTCSNDSKNVSDEKIYEAFTNYLLMLIHKKFNFGLILYTAFLCICKIVFGLEEIAN